MSLHSDSDAVHNAVTQITVTPPCTRETHTAAGFTTDLGSALILRHSDSCLVVTYQKCIF